MIYASLKPIRQWHTRWTPVAYLVLGHWSGALIAARDRAATTASNSVRLAHLCVALALLAVLVKWGYWRASRERAAARRRSSRRSASRRAFARRRPRARRASCRRGCSTPATRGRTFLTDEFVFRLARQRRRAGCSPSFWLAGIALPLVWVVGAWWQTPSSSAACVVSLLGLLAERSLFFADARHTVRLYHGERRRA